MFPYKIISNYDDYNYNIISFKSLIKSRIWQGYAYNISKKRINKGIELLKNEKIFNLVKSEIHNNWQESYLLSESKIIQEDLKHPIRISFLILDIPINGITPIEIDTYSRSYSHIEGHHRLLALKYLKCKYIPIYFSGSVDILEEFKVIK